MNDLGERVEGYLLNQRGWVPAAELCRVFAIGQRALRGAKGSPGLCSGFAISGDKGYRHVATATDGEFDRFDARMGDHAIGELQRRRKLRARRRELLAVAAAVVPMTREGQALLFSQA